MGLAGTGTAGEQDIVGSAAAMQLAQQRFIDPLLAKLKLARSRSAGRRTASIVARPTPYWIASSLFSPHGCQRHRWLFP